MKAINRFLASVPVPAGRHSKPSLRHRGLSLRRQFRRHRTATKAALPARQSISLQAAAVGICSILEAHRETLPAELGAPLGERSDHLARLLSGQGAELNEEETELLRTKWGGWLFTGRFRFCRREKTYFTITMRNKTLIFKPLPYPQTPQSAKAYFVRHGINRSAWARYFGLEVNTVAHLLGGRYRGRRGGAHTAAVLLGLKENLNGQ